MNAQAIGVIITQIIYLALFYTFHPINASNSHPHKPNNHVHPTKISNLKTDGNLLYPSVVIESCRCKKRPTASSHFICQKGNGRYPIK